MAKKQFFCLVDTESSISDRVADFAAIVCDRNGTIYAQCAVLVAGTYGVDELFFDKAASDVWGTAGLEKRKANYARMLESGERMLASVAAINRWIDKAIAQFNPTLTAYNLAFDKNLCKNSSINLSGFANEFCLWQAAVGNICDSRNYRAFVLKHHLFNAPTELRNMTFSTNAESVAGYLKGDFQKEPHSALEDARDFEKPILCAVLKRKKWREKIKPYQWRDFQVRDHFCER